MIKLNEVFSNVFWMRSHKQHFGSKWGKISFGRSIDDLSFENPLIKYPQLHGLALSNDYQCPKPLKV